MLVLLEIALVNVLLNEYMMMINASKITSYKTKWYHFWLTL